MSLLTRIRLFLGLDYQCRCGAIVGERWRAGHEEIHDAMREFCRPPTVEEFQAAMGETPVEPTP